MFFWLFLICFATGAWGKTYTFEFLSTKIEVIDSAEAAPIMVRNDSYTGSFSLFDVQSRLRDTGKTSEEDYLLFAERQSRNWTKEEREKLEQSFKEIARFIRKNDMVLNLPVIRIIKSTCAEEYGSMGYTRGNNIMLNVNEATLTTELVAHELFHVFSRYNEEKRNSLYLSIGFKRCDHIDMKKAFDGLNVTNPDCPVVAHYITVNDKDLVIALYSMRKYNGGDPFREYMNIALLELENKGKRKVPKMVENKPVLHQFSELPQIQKQIGTNTNYALHPEEILAEHFSALVTSKKVKEPAYLDRVKAALSR